MKNIVSKDFTLPPQVTSLLLHDCTLNPRQAAIGMAWGRFEGTVNVHDWNASGRFVGNAWIF